MRLAVTCAEGKVYQHFGHTVRFKIYDVENGEVKLATTINTNGSSGGALPDILRKLEVNALICGGIGSGAKRSLANAGICLYSGVTGEADQAVEAFLKGGLEFEPGAVCERREEHRGGR